MAAMAAVVREDGEQPTVPSLPYSRRSLTSKANGHSSRSSDQVPTVGATTTSNRQLSQAALSSDDLSKGSDVSSTAHGGSVVTDGPPLSSVSGHAGTKARSRRASEGSHLIKGDGKRDSGTDLRCDKCGKGYKHSSCLTKHLWEHTPEWSYTSKLLISKHQQVQLLEAASVLVAMNQDDIPSDLNKDANSDQSSASPAASGSSGMRGDVSSTDTTPPPQSDEHTSGAFSLRGSRSGRSKRHSGNGSGYSRSYQSAPQTGLSASSAPSATAGFGQFHYLSTDSRPSTSGAVPTSQQDDDEAGLAAAVELLSCSFGTPRSGPVTLPHDVPPVPPLPARYMGTNQSNVFGNSVPGLKSKRTGRPSAPYLAQVDGDVRMNGDDTSAGEDDENDHRFFSKVGPSDEEDDGVFGRMEE
ncbi:MAG: hypothetical protein M1833_000580 [Piccolia ochrophora]|nr:MAG: hypothetical protein M1833_000580 [Piccolia ochrophora]